MQQVTKGVVSEVVEATEEFFSERGEKWLRANCGGLLAKDESYGFLLTNLVVGKLAPRDASITLGEKMRKEHAKVKKKQADSKRSIGKLPIALRSAAIIDAARERADLLAEPASKELIELIPSALSCSSVQRGRKRIRQSLRCLHRSQSRRRSRSRTLRSSPWRQSCWRRRQLWQRLLQLVNTIEQQEA